jgi:two-component system response regulator VicR
MPKILFVDDDEGLLDLLSFLAQRDGLRPILATNSSGAQQLLEEERPDLLVLDSRLGAEDGLEVLQTVRRSSQVPIIMLSSLDSEEDIERALELGADDYVTKPIAFREFVARIRAVLRRTCNARPAEAIDHWMRVGPLALNPLEHAATLHGLPLELTRTEFRLLHVLMENTDKVVPHCVLLKQVWGYDDPAATDVVRAALYRLRRKLVDTGSDQSMALRTIPGIGVMLQYGSEQREVRRTEPLIERYAPSRETLPLMVAA